MPNEGNEPDIPQDRIIHLSAPLSPEEIAAAALVIKKGYGGTTDMPDDANEIKKILSGVSSCELTEIGVRGYETEYAAGITTDMRSGIHGKSAKNILQPYCCGYSESKLIYNMIRPRIGEAYKNGVIVGEKSGGILFLKIAKRTLPSERYYHVFSRSTFAVYLHGWVIWCDVDRIPVMKAALIKIGKENLEMGNAAYNLYMALSMLTESKKIFLPTHNTVLPINLLQAMDQAARTITRKDIEEATPERAKEALYTAEKESSKMPEPEPVPPKKTRESMSKGTRSKLAAAGIALGAGLGALGAGAYIASLNSPKVVEKPNEEKPEKPKDLDKNPDDEIIKCSFEEGFQKGYIIVTEDGKLAAGPGYEWVHIDDPEIYAVKKKKPPENKNSK